MTNLCLRGRGAHHLGTRSRSCCVSINGKGQRPSGLRGTGLGQGCPEANSLSPSCSSPDACAQRLKDESQLWPKTNSCGETLGAEGASSPSRRALDPDKQRFFRVTGHV